MGFNAVISLCVRLVLLLGGVVLVTGGILQWGVWAVACGCVLVVAGIVYVVKAQVALRSNSKLMLEAVKNDDFSFRLRNKWLSPYERIMQDTLNSFGRMMGKQKILAEQREQFFGLILANVRSGVVVLDGDGQVVQANAAAADMLHVPAIVSLQQLARFDSGMPDMLERLKGGEQAQVEFHSAAGDVSLLVKASEINLGGEKMRILIMNDIKSELDAKELATWIKMSRVLTHEIMNSVAPIVSLSKTFLERDDVKRSGIYEGMQAIHETSAGLISFVNNYRVASTLQNPAPEPFYLVDILRQVEGLGIVPANVDFSYNICPKDLIIYADPNLIRQVLINIVKNAVQAIGKADGRIHVKAVVSPDDRVMVYVCNDGPVIPWNVAEEIFTPFFTTKTDGNGIGLSLSRQIMKLSGGSIDLLDTSSDGWPVTFQLRFD